MRSRNYGLLGPGSMLTLLFSIETLPRFLSGKSKKPGFSPLSWMEKQSVKVEDTCYLLFESRYEAAFSIACLTHVYNSTRVFYDSQAILLRETLNS